MAGDRAQNLQDTFLNHVRKNKIPLTIFLVNGVKLQGVVTWFDNFCVLLRRDGHSQLVYKHAISTIMPGHPVQLFDQATRSARRRERSSEAVTEPRTPGEEPSRPAARSRKKMSRPGPEHARGRALSRRARGGRGPAPRLAGRRIRARPRPASTRRSGLAGAIDLDGRPGPDRAADVAAAGDLSRQRQGRGARAASSRPRRSASSCMDCALSPVQQRNLEKAWGAKVIDRTGLILEIFGRRARTKEGALQVELAHLSYQKSRLVRSWTHLERQRGGFGFLGGPGETQIEADRRLIQERMTPDRARPRNRRPDPRAAPQEPAAGAVPHRRPRRLHQCRQVDALQPHDAGRCPRREHAVCDPRPDLARDRPAAWREGDPVGHGGLHLRSADDARRGLSRDPGGRDRSRRAPARPRRFPWRDGGAGGRRRDVSCASSASIRATRRISSRSGTRRICSIAADRERLATAADRLPGRTPPDPGLGADGRGGSGPPRRHRGTSLARSSELRGQRRRRRTAKGSPGCSPTRKFWNGACRTRAAPSRRSVSRLERSRAS